MLVQDAASSFSTAVAQSHTLIGKVFLPSTVTRDCLIASPCLHSLLRGVTMFAARRASISSALARADSSASAALAIGSYVRSCVALDLSFHVVTVTDWCLLTERMEGMLLLCSGEHYIVVKPTARAKRWRCRGCHLAKGRRCCLRGT